MGSLKLFLVIFFSVFLALFAHKQFELYLWSEALKYLSDRMKSEKTILQPISQGLQRDLNALSRRTSNQTAYNKSAPQNQHQSKALEQKIKNAWEVCRFWTVTHAEHNTERTEKLMKEHCDQYRAISESGI